jgi:FAS-associated factor 2
MIIARIISRPAITNNSKKRDPRVLAFEFIESFEAKYGQNHVEFFKGGYSQALEKARRELRFMLVILQSDDHDNTLSFCRDTLTSTRVIDFIKEKNILVWAGNVVESEAHKG